MNSKARAVGINHVSIQVSNIQEAVNFYNHIFSIKIGFLSDSEGSIELGDQFVAFTVGESSDNKPGHFGFVVDDKSKVQKALDKFGISPLPGRFFGFLDPWGNHVEIINYDNIKFSKSSKILKSMGLCDLKKNKKALKELNELYSTTEKL